MKRKSVKYTNVALETIYNHYGVMFWQDCLFCGQEFRRERGYRFQLQINRDWVYSCANCCSSKDEVNTKVGELRKRRPKAPAAPQSKRK